MTSIPSMDRRQVLQTSAIAAGVIATAGSGAAIIAPAKPIPVAFLIDENATVIDFTGPWEVFQDAGVANNPGFELFTVAPNKAPLRATGGLQIVPDYTLADAPPAKVIVIPAQQGGRTAKAGDARVVWLKQRFAQTDVIMSVCTGAFLLARTGLLDGLKATTHHDYLADFRTAFPKVSVVEAQRFVDNGRLIATSGLSSGIEGALHVVERYYGAAAAKTVAYYMEYVPTQWRPA